MRTFSRTATPLQAPARSGLSDSRSTGAPAATTLTRQTLLTDRRSTR